MKKYARVNRRVENHPVRDGMITVWSIKALVDIPAHNVRAGDIGGSIDKKSNLSQTGDAWIGDSSYVLDKSSVEDDALVTDEAVVSGVIVKNHAKVYGNAVVLEGNSPSLSDSGFYVSNFAEIHDFAKVSGSYVTDNSVINGASVVTRSVLKGTSRISGFARVIGPNIRLVDTLVYGSAEIMSDTNFYKAKIHCSARILSHSKINSSVIAGNTSIADATITSNRRDYNGNLKERIEISPCMIEGQQVDSCAHQYPDDGYLDPEPLTLGEVLNLEGKTQVKLEIKKASSFDRSRLDEVETAYATYEQDIVKLIKYPVMTDLTDEYTAAFHSLLRKVRRVADKEDQTAYKETIDSLDDAFFAAESNARRIATSMFSDEDKSKVTDAGQMIAMALNEKASATEKKNAYKGAMRNLEGRVSLPEVTIMNLLERIGLKELEA
jgi:hypothetical protein